MSQFRNGVTNNFKFALFKLSKLPLAFFAGLKVKEISDEIAVVQIKHNHWTKNPFKSMYFAAQAMAAELSTGLLVMDKVSQAKPRRISMLVRKMDAEFTKKATGNIQFTCNDGVKLNEAFNKILNSDEGETINMKTIGKDEHGDIVSTFHFLWTVKEKK